MDKKYFYSLNEYYRKTYGQKAYKISLNGGMSCPNRDGTLSSRGCIFFFVIGSGDFAAGSHMDICDQITEGIRLISDKYKGDCYIGYFRK